jgi:hypothetical protein
MGLQPMGKVPDLRRLAGTVASRSTVRRSWLRTWAAPRWTSRPRFASHCQARP